MTHPAEELIRDYLKRLRVAARDHLDPAARRALRDDTLAHIQRETTTTGRPAAVDVGRVLARLGDPRQLVDEKRKRIAAEHGAAGFSGAERDTATAPEPAVSGGRAGRNSKRGEPGIERGSTRPRRASRSSRPDLWPALLGRGASAEGGAAASEGRAAASEGGVAEADDGVADAGIGAADADASEPALAEDATEADRGTAEINRSPVPDDLEDDAGPDRPAPGDGEAEPPIWVPRPLPVKRDEPAWPPDDLDVVDSARTSNGAVVAPEPEGSEATQAGQPVQAAPSRPGQVPWRGVMAHDGGGQDLASLRETAVGRSAHHAGNALLGFSRRQPLEAISIVGLGLAGAIYPPLWLAGAALALFSRLWDYRDKWIGLGTPILLTALGIAVGLRVGANHGSVRHALHEAWMYALVVSRIGAALGAGYLAWRSAHGRRPPVVPPWNRPGKIA